MSTGSQPAAVPLCPLVARERELRTLVRLWRSSRLVTLYGQSGVGKSVLAHAAADALEREGVAPVVRLDARTAGGRRPVLRLLAGIRQRSRSAPLDPPLANTPSANPSAIAPDPYSQTGVETDREPLLFVLLDDVQAAAHIAAQGVLQWLVTHPHAHLLIISPRPLDLLGEQSLPLAPLPTQSTGGAAAPALELFRSLTLDGRLGGPSVSPDAAATICEALDGLPAALEAAAALVGTLPEAEIIRIAGEEPFSLTLRGRSLHEIVTATWNDLSPEARDYLVGNADWRASFSDPAATHLSNSGSTSSIAPRLTQLGLLRVVADRPHLRYRLSPLIRRIAREKAISSPVARQERRAHCLLHLAQHSAGDRGAGTMHPDDLQAMRWAWRWLAGQREGGAVQRFARALAGPLRHALGDPMEAAELLESALSWARQESPAEARCLESELAATECRLGRLDAAEARLQALLDTDLSPHQRAMARLRRAAVLRRRGSHGAAVEDSEEALSYLHSRVATTGDGRVEVALAWALCGLAHDLERTGQAERARTALDESDALFTRLESFSGRSATLAALAAHHLEQGEVEEARGEAEESLRLAELAADGPSRARALPILGRIMGRDDPQEGNRSIQEAASLWERYSQPIDQAMALLDLASLAQTAGFPAEHGLRPARRALRLARRCSCPAIEAAALLCLAGIYRHLDRNERGAAYVEAARRAGAYTDDVRIRRFLELWPPGDSEGNRLPTRFDREPPSPASERDASSPAAGRPVDASRPVRTASGTPPTLRIRLLGPLQVEGPDGAGLTAPLRPKEKRLLARLALEPGQVVPRDELLDLFWPKANLAAAERSLRTAVSSLRGALRPLWQNAAPALLRGRMDGYCLESAACTIDVVLFREAVREARGASTNEGATEQALGAWGRAIDLYHGDLLSEFRYDDWCLAARERLRDDLLDALFCVARAALETGSLAEAREMAARMVALDPAEERAHRLLMRCYALMGRPAEAVRQFERCREALFEELGGRPAPVTIALVEAIRAGATPAIEADEDGTGTASP